MMNPSGQNEQKPNLISPNFAPLPQTVQFQANPLNLNPPSNSNVTTNSISSTSSSPLTMLQKPNLSPQSINLSKALAKPPPLSSILTLPKNALLNANAPNLPNGSSGGGGGSMTPSSLLVTNSNSSSLSPSPSPFSLSLTSSSTQQASSTLLASNKPTDIATGANLSLSSSSIFKNNSQDQHHQHANNFSNSMPATTTAQLFSQATNTSNASQIFNRPSLTPAQPNLAINATLMAATSQSPPAQFQNQSNSSLNSSSQSSLDQFNNSNSGMFNRMTNTNTVTTVTASAAQFSTNLQQNSQLNLNGLHINQQSQPSSASHLFPVQAPPPPTTNNPIISFPQTTKNVNNTFANSNNNQIGSLAPTASIKSNQPPLGYTSLGPSQINQQPQQFQSFPNQAPSAQPLTNSNIPNNIAHIGTLPASQQLQPSMPQPPPLMNFNRGGPPISLVGPLLSQTGPPISNNTPLINGPPLGGVSNSVQQNFNRSTAPPTNQGPPITNSLQNNGPPLQQQQQQQNFQPNQPPLSNRPPGPPITTNQGGPLQPPPTTTNNNLLQNNNGPQNFQPTIATPSQPTFNRPGPPQTNQPPTNQPPTNQPPTNQFNTMSISQQPQFQQQPQQQSHTSSQSNRNQPNAIDLLREKRLIQPYSDESDQPARPIFPHEFYTQVNCHADTIRCTLTAIPETQSLLSKLRLPLGILIHPFKDLESLKVVQSATIVRCRSCRSYINPFVHFLDNSKWRCNMCYSINDLPDEFLFDPVTRSYGDPSKRPEINSSTIEFIAPPEYTLRPPPSAMYIYLLDVSHNAISTGYLASFCETLLENLDKIPGDSRTQIGFITYNSALHFYNLSDSLSQPRMMIYPDLEDLELPMPDSLLVNLNENKESIKLFLESLPNLFADTYETDSALGTALNSAYLLLKQTGGRITIMQSCLPNVGIGALKKREENIDKDSSNLAPQTDFYKKLALDCAGAQICVDLFMFNSLYADLATLSCVSKYSGGEIKYYPGFHADHFPEQVIRYCVDFKRYVTRKIGFESVMRIRCTRGLAIHTFHGNFFVRSTDLLSLPNVNPDAGFGMQVNIEESLSDIPTVCFQAAVLYTSSKSERRIRIHTYCLPVSKSLNELVNGADQEAIVGLVAKMAVDRTGMNSLKEAKEAMVNVAIDYLQAYGQHIVSAQKHNSLMTPYSLRILPTYLLALIKNIAFKFGSVKMDDRVYAMNLCKTMPLKYLMMTIYPHLYAVHNIDDKKTVVDSSDVEICIPPRLQLCSENIDRHGVYIMDCGEAIYMWIGRSVSDKFLQQVFDCKSFQELPDHSNDLPDLENALSERIRNFLVFLYDNRPFGPTFLFFREDSSKSSLFFQHMHEDKTESTISYYEFLRHLNEQINN